MKRLGIFAFYDKDGIVDDYVIYLLESIKDYLDDLLIICQGEVCAAGRKRLEEMASNVYCTQKNGSDAVSYKAAMTQCLGWEQVRLYDEVLTFNDSFFGPIYPFSQIFDVMDERACDFWGLTYQAEMFDYFSGTGDVLPDYVHSYFMLYRRRVLESSAFREYWDKLQESDCTERRTVRHEQFFTRYLEEAGFTWDTYAGVSEYHSKEPGSNCNQLYYLACELVRDYHCPMILKENFRIKHMSMQSGNTGEDTANAFQYIEEHTDYDTNLIWSHILRVYNIAQIKDALHLDYVLPWKLAEQEPDRHMRDKTAVIAHLYYEQLCTVCMQYLKQVPKGIRIYIATSNSRIAEMAEKEFQSAGRTELQVLPVPNKGRDMGTLLIACKDLFKEYEYICFVHDKKTKASVGPATIGKSFFYNMWENMLKSSAYIENILKLFEQNCRMGFLAPPQPIHAEFFSAIGREWHSDYRNTVKLADRLGLKVNLSEDIPCFALSNTFWCRTKALMPLMNYGFTYDDLPKEPMPEDGTISHAIERIYPYVAQSEGYYSGIVMNTDYASLQNTNLHFYLSGALSRIRMQNVITDYASIFQKDILSYCRDKKNIFIYGAGINGKKAHQILRKSNIEMKGFIISDDQPVQDGNEYPVFRVSQIPCDCGEAAVIVAVSRTKDRREVLNNLTHHGYQDFLLL